MINFRTPKSNDDGNFELNSNEWNIDEDNFTEFKLDGFDLEEEPCDSFGFKIDDITDVKIETNKSESIVENDNRPKYDNLGRKIEYTKEKDEFDNDFDADRQCIEFGIIDLNKYSISTENQWNVEDEKPGAFFIYNPCRDLSYSRIYIRNKENQEIVWQSPIRLLDDEITLEDKKSPIVYMSSRVLFTENIDTKNGKYEIVIEDDELEAVDFIVVDNREKFKDIVIKKEESLSKYIINRMLNYFPVNIDIVYENEQCNEFTQSIIIEKIGNEYTVLINKLEGILNKSLFFRNGDTIYHNEEEGIVSFLEKIEKKICITYDLSSDEYNSFRKLIIVDDEQSKNELLNSYFEEDRNEYIIDRKDVFKGFVNENRALIDIDDSSLGILFTDENKNLVNIRTRALGTNITENIVGEIKAISELFDSNIILTGKEIDFKDEESLEFKSLSQLIAQ